MPKVIILRGNSGSGKSTTANTLVKCVRHPTVIIEQDNFREHMFFPRGEYRLGTRDFSDESMELMVINVLYALNNGFDVIWVGVFSAKKYKEYFHKFFSEHSIDEFYVFDYVIIFDETVRRHATRTKSQDFGAEEMSKWYREVEVLGLPNEYTIPQDSTLEQTVEYIRKTANVQ